ncbi:hypothetical protein SOASR032_17240 [Pragia fontium]|uniref:Uncharacterized protein n=1 Tax=Pragia fontium TaxID=82985 RepID=A0ABQ5LHS3_9GAMM|nr:hypothetical protein SOASR032_17240 [Pragia fontium]
MGLLWWIDVIDVLNKQLRLNNRVVLRTLRFFWKWNLNMDAWLTDMVLSNVFMILRNLE